MKKLFKLVIVFTLAFIGCFGCKPKPEMKTYVKWIGCYDQFGSLIRQDFALYYYGPNIYAQNTSDGVHYYIDAEVLSYEAFSDSVWNSPPTIKVLPVYPGYGTDNCIKNNSIININIRCNTSVHKSVTLRLKFGDAILWEGTLDNLTRTI